jgi:enterochelin esterase-like enzyme
MPARKLIKSFKSVSSIFCRLCQIIGRGATRYSWVTQGRLADIVDNLLAEGKALPMIVVVPEAHAFDVDSSYDKNQAAIDEELFHDIIPSFVEARYNVSHDSRERAIAGLSMGGLQSTETGIVHLGYFPG